MAVKLTELCVLVDGAIREAIACIDRNQHEIALIVDETQKLIGTVTDGDVRRLMLAGTDVNAPIRDFLAQKETSFYPYSKPVTALVGTPVDEVLALMRERRIRQIPLLDGYGKVVDLVTFDDLMPQADLQLHAVVMAGGRGTRLYPLTEDLPKPMLPVGGRPLMERIVEQLQQAGIRKVNVTTHYKPEKIVEHFGDGQSFGVELKYVNEDQPLGTGGALSLLPAPKEPLLVINGDILTQVDFRLMLSYHNEHQADMTVAVGRHDLSIPYGVVECDGARILSLKEKPQMTYFVNAGIYLLEPSVYEFIPNAQHFNMTDLIQKLIDADRMVVSFPIREYWLDIGQHTDYEQAQMDMQNGRWVE